MPALTPPPGVVVRLADVFRSEITAVRDLGCKLEVRTDAGVLGGTAYARISPVTPQATRGLRLAAEQDGAPGRKAIEVRLAYEQREETREAVRAAIGQALDIARAALT